MIFQWNALHLSTLLFNVLKAAFMQVAKKSGDVSFPTWVFWTADRDVTIFNTFACKTRACNTP